MLKLLSIIFISIISITPPSTPTAINSRFSISMAVKSGIVTVYIKVNNKNHFALGTGSKMKNSDMLVVETVGDKITIGDYFSLSDTTPTKDSINDWTLVDSVMGSSGYEVLVTRKSSTGNTSDDRDIVTGNNNFIWSNPESKVLMTHGSNTSFYGAFSLTVSENGSTNSSKIFKTITVLVLFLIYN